MNTPAPEALLARAAGGDRAAFAALYRQFERPLYRFVAGKLNDPFEANDICHEVFMEVWRQAARFEGRSSARTWIFGIAYRKTMDHFRKHGRTVPTDDLPDTVDETPDAATCLAAAQDAAHVRHCLDRLKTEMRMAVELAFYEDMTYAEIAEVSQTAEGTIKSRIFHAKKLLLHCLSGRLTRGTA